MAKDNFDNWQHSEVHLFKSRGHQPQNNECQIHKARLLASCPHLKFCCFSVGKGPKWIRPKRLGPRNVSKPTKGTWALESKWILWAFLLICSD